MDKINLAIKIDVDTERGTRIGVPNLLKLFEKYNIKTTFLFSLGPDNTGRALKRIFRPGFFKKVSRTSVIQTYGLKTLMNGVLIPGPHIGNKHKNIIINTKSLGHETGIHCYDHVKWQDNLAKMNLNQTKSELNKANLIYKKLFGCNASTAGAAGWQANKNSLIAYDELNFDYASDARGTSPFYPVINNQKFKTLQLPTTLPTFDELLGRPEYPKDNLINYYLSLIKPNQLNIFTIHAEMEGMAHLDWFSEFIHTAIEKNIEFKTCEYLANQYLENNTIPYCQLNQDTIDGRSGLLATQGELYETD